MDMYVLFPLYTRSTFHLCTHSLNLDTLKKNDLHLCIQLIHHRQKNRAQQQTPKFQKDDADLVPFLTEISKVLKDAESSDNVNLVYLSNIGKVIEDTVTLPEKWVDELDALDEQFAASHRGRSLHPQQLEQMRRMRRLQIKTRTLVLTLGRVIHNIRRSGYVKDIMEDMRLKEVAGEVLTKTSPTLALKNLFAFIKCLQSEMMHCPKGSPFRYTLGDIMDSYCEYYDPNQLWRGGGL